MKNIMFEQLVKLKTLSSERHVLVYQMGKVGSASVSKSLDRVGRPNSHIHTFDDHEEFLIFNKNNDIKLFFNPVLRFAYRRVLSFRLRALKGSKKVTVVTLVRDPLAVIVSRFFQDLHLFMIEAKRTGAVHRDNDVFFEFVSEEFRRSLNIDYFTGWFDSELSRNFGLDVFSVGFNKDEGFSVVESASARALVVKMENLDGLEDVFREFLDQKDFSLMSSNKSSDKWYSQIYNRFVREFDFTEYSYIYQSNLAMHFYTEDEIVKFKKKWRMI